MKASLLSFQFQLRFLTGIDVNIQYQDGVRCSDLVSGEYDH
jgi:hypothetical protein